MAILPTIDRVSEKMVREVMTDHFGKYISPSQHCLTKRSFVLTNVIEFTSKYGKGIEPGIVCTDVCFIVNCWKSEMGGSIELNHI